MRDFAGKNVLITGGSSGIGLAVAKKLISKGANVTIFSRNPTTASEAINSLNSIIKNGNLNVRCDSVLGDVTDYIALKNVVKTMSDRGHSVDVLIASAGIAHPSEIYNLDIGIAKNMIDIDLLGSIYTTKAVIPEMIKKNTLGHIVLISSMAGIIGVYGYSVYGAAKFGVRGFAEGLRQELKPHKINVTVVYPPDTDTPQFAYENQFKPEATKAIAGNIKPVSADFVAECLINGIKRNKFQVVPTFTAKLMCLVNNLFTPFVRFYLDSIVFRIFNKTK